MSDELDNEPLLFETLAATLELDRREQRSLIESLATMLSGALPEQVTVTRGGWMLSKDKPIEELLVRFEDVHYQIVKQKHGSSYSGRALKVVRGVVLKTSEIEIGICVEQIVKEVSTLAEKSTRMRAALQKFIAG